MPNRAIQYVFNGWNSLKPRFMTRDFEDRSEISRFIEGRGNRGYLSLESANISASPLLLPKFSDDDPGSSSILGKVLRDALTNAYRSIAQKRLSDDCGPINAYDHFIA